MSLERVRRATKEEFEEIKVLKQGILDYLELKGIDDSLVLSTLACLTAQAAIDKKVEMKNIFKLFRSIWEANSNSKKEDTNFSDNVEVIKKRINDTLEDGEFQMMEVLTALSILAMGAAAYLKFSKSRFQSAIDSVWDEIEKNYENR
jgi:hypothetical protein